MSTQLILERLYSNKYALSTYYARHWVDIKRRTTATRGMADSFNASKPSIWRGAWPDVWVRKLCF